MTAAILAFLVACNPAAALLALGHDRRTDRPLPVVIGAAAAIATLLTLAMASEPILDVLDLNLGTFRVGAGVVLVAAGLRWLVAGSPPSAEEPQTDTRLAGFIFFPTLMTPGATVLAVTVGADAGVATAAVGILLAVGLGAVGVYERRRMPVALAGAFVRLLGAGSVVVGIGLVVEGIRTL